ncbi:DUF1564 domain-containing protein [Leptospira sp. WS92.C1]
MGKWILNEDTKIQSRLEESGTNVETILVPESYLNRLSEEDRKSLPKRVLPLLRRYGKYIASMKRLNSKAGKTMYQKNRGKLIRMNVRVSSGTWTMLGAYAASHGVSRCFLVNYMLWLEDIGVGESISETLNVGTPSFHDIYSYTWTLDRCANIVIRKFSFHPNPIFAKDLDYFP